MATYFKCDGCGNAVENPARVGHVVRRDYCADCKQIAEKYIAEEEELRKVLQERFIDDRALLIARYQAGDFKLPDLP